MNSITFTCEVVTPMFLAGADGIELDLRPPSIKGAMRFWWRSMNGYLSISDLRKQEADIFGGTDEKVGRSKLLVRTSHPELTAVNQRPLPHHTGGDNCLICRQNPSEKNCKKGYKNQAIPIGYRYETNLSLTREIIVNPDDTFDICRLESLFLLTCLFGGLGKRSRRGYGSVIVNKKNEVLFNMPSTLQDVMLHLGKFNSHFEFDNSHCPSSIVLSRSSFPERTYPYIESIQIGQTVYPDYDSLLLKIGKASHDFKNKNDHSLGYAEKGDRLASPVCVSVLKKGLKDYRAIITTLHMATKDDKFKVNRQKQKNFKNAIL